MKSVTARAKFQSITCHNTTHSTLPPGMLLEPLEPNLMSRPSLPFAFRFRYELRGLLVIWNTMLAMFSIMGAFRTAPELIHVLRHHGLFHSVCIPR